MNKLFTPIKLGNLELANRIAMAPMTRARAVYDVADHNTALYYQQRATAGLLITEGSPISQQGKGYLFIPGIYTDAQVEGWKDTTKRVHDAGGKIFIQLWHVGRVSHTSLQPNGQAPVSSSDKPAEGCSVFALDENGQSAKVSLSKPQALTLEAIEQVKQDYVNAARNAIKAGFDGVEIHGANGYLIEQFINPSVNTRNDQYGSQTIENRLRFVLEVVDAVIDAIGYERTGIRISPFGRVGDMPAFDQELETWLQLGKALSQHKVCYVHLSDQITLGSAANSNEFESGFPDGFLDAFRSVYDGVLIMAGGFNKQRAEHYLEAGKIDVVAFGRPFIPNPDLVERMRNDWPLAEAPRSVFYGGDNQGYIDFPTYTEQQALTK